MSISSSVKLYAVGDSITAGLGNQYTVASTDIFPFIFNYNQREIVNRGIGHGSMVYNTDLAWSLVDSAIMNNPVSEWDKYILLTGVNDMFIGVSHKNQYKAGLRASLAWMGIPDIYKKTSRNAGVSYTGTWANDTGQYGGLLSKATVGNGATATMSINGTTLFLQVTTYSTGGSFDVTIDGQAQSRIELSDAWGRYPKVIVYSGLSNTTHTVVLTSVSNGSQPCQFDWIGGLSGGERKPRIYVGNCIKMTATGYSGNGGSDADVATYNTEILAACNEMITAGIDVIHCDISGSYNPNTAGQVQSDGVHPSTAGHSTIGNAFKTYIQ
jgi:lysophospholipase L1-like esterase